MRSLAPFVLAAGLTAPFTFAADPPVPCAALVTPEEIRKAIGRPVREAEARVENDGGSLCAWMKGDDGKFFTAAVQFWSAEAITARTPGATVAAEYDGWVESGTAAGSTKSEPLAGIGVRAVLMHPEPQLMALVERPDGVARIVGNGLTKAQMTAIAKAVATP